MHVLFTDGCQRIYPHGLVVHARNVVEGLAATQAEKLKSLAENVDFNNADEFTSKITTLRESYFPTTVKAQKELDSVDATAAGKSMIQEELQGPMAKYVQALGKKLPN